MIKELQKVLCTESLISQELAIAYTQMGFDKDLDKKIIVHEAPKFNLFDLYVIKYILSCPVKENKRLFQFSGDLFELKKSLEKEANCIFSLSFVLKSLQHISKQRFVFTDSQDESLNISNLFLILDFLDEETSLIDLMYFIEFNHLEFREEIKEFRFTINIEPYYYHYLNQGITQLVIKNPY